MKGIIVSIIYFILSISSVEAIAGNITIPHLYKSYKSDISYSAKKIAQNQDIALETAAVIGASFFADKAVKNYFVEHKNKTMNHFTNLVAPGNI